MALHCLALLGSKNEPLYLCAGSPVDDDDAGSSYWEETGSGGEDVFGFHGEMSAKSGSSARPASIRHETMVHAALDRLEELLGSPKKSSLGRFFRGSHWLGSICPMEEYEVYGYVTSSDVKILALIERENIVPLKKRKEVDIKILFTEVHECYVKHTMNPFTKMRAKIEPPCRDFEKGIQTAMLQYNNAVVEN